MAEDIRDKLKKTVFNKDVYNQIIETIVKQKKEMFNSNSHDWHPLAKKTIEDKNKIRGLYRSPESINIRKGQLYKQLTTNSNYKVKQSSSYIDINVNANNKKVETVAEWGRDVIELKQYELDEITNKITNELIVNIQKLK